MTPDRPVDARPATLSRSTLLLLALAYTAFAVYGSFVPLNFKPISLQQAWARFAQIQWLDLGAGQRADWVANILLFVPLAFFWLGTIWPRQAATRLAASALVWTAAVALAVGIEFAQAYFPGRTISFNDIVAEWLGAAFGVAAWWAVGPAVSAWVAGLRAVARPMTAIERIMTAYVVVVVAYALLPLDLTLSATEIFRKWKQGRVILMPFAFYEGNAAESLYSILSEVGLWAPMGVFVARRWPSTLRVAALRVAGGGLALEFLQLFVFSRTTDINDVLAAGLGGLTGAWLGRRAGLTAATAAPPSMRISGGLGAAAAMALLWAAGAALVFWYPFDFNFDRAFIRGKLDRVPNVMFASYYWGSEFNAVTQVMRKMVYFMPLGAVLAWGRSSIYSLAGQVAYTMGSFAFVVGAAVAIEIGQLALPRKIVDPTDVVLAACGAAVGWAVISWLVRLGVRTR